MRAREPLKGGSTAADVEAVAYGVPAFKYRWRPLVSFGAAKR
jgi:hypothetical protein